jgi:hypothetical protein
MIKFGRIVIGIAGVLLLTLTGFLAFYSSYGELFVSTVRRKEWSLVAFLSPNVLIYFSFVFVGFAYIWRAIKGK